MKWNAEIFLRKNNHKMRFMLSISFLIELGHVNKFINISRSIKENKISLTRSSLSFFAHSSQQDRNITINKFQKKRFKEKKLKFSHFILKRRSGLMRHLLEEREVCRVIKNWSMKLKNKGSRTGSKNWIFWFCLKTQKFKIQDSLTQLEVCKRVEAEGMRLRSIQGMNIAIKNRARS
jgi:hypothetical protein